MKLTSWSNTITLEILCQHTTPHTKQVETIFSIKWKKLNILKNAIQLFNI